MPEAAERGRQAYARQAWGEAYEELSAADADGALAAEDLERLAVAAFLTGRDEERLGAMERAHRGFLDRGDARDAARCAFWTGMGLMQRGDGARASGWFARAERILEDQPDAPERGYLMIPVALGQLGQGAHGDAHRTFQEIAAIADVTDDADLTAFSRLGLGESLAVGGMDVDRGLNLLDEVMVSVESGEVSPMPAGIIYCAVIEACWAVLDLERARQWTEALSAWCASQPDLVPFRGQCLVHRAEILQLGGRWGDALEEARRAVEQLHAAPDEPAVGAAYYRLGEVHRLRGEFDEAEGAYREANRWGHPSQPGLAQLRLAQGQLELADAALRRARGEPHDPARRATILTTAVEVALARDDVASARTTADELADLARTVDAPLLHAMADHVAGAVLLVEGQPDEALGSLRSALTGWRELDAPFEAARVRVLAGLACRELGDTDGAELELDAARATFAQLGASPELRRLDDLLGDADGTPSAGGLTDREIEVLQHVASGMTNRAIADELVISEHTVARHVQNIFTKLGVSSRTAAAAFAYEHDLL